MSNQYEKYLSIFPGSDSYKNTVKKRLRNSYCTAFPMVEVKASF